MVRRARVQSAAQSAEHNSVRQLRVLAAIAFLFALVIATVAPAVVAVPQAFADSSTASSSSSVDYATWTEVSKAMDKKLEEGQKTYKDGNTAGSTSAFMAAYNQIYVASNFTAVVHDTIGADKQLAQQQAFQSIQNLSYTAGNDDQLDQQITALTADLDATAQQLDANTSLAKPKAYAEALQKQLAKERKELDAKKKKNPGKGNRSWTDVANEMTPILDNAYKAYAAGDGAKGATLVNNAYYQYYEKLGFEKNVMNAISGDRVSQVEYQFKMCRKSMNTGASLKDTKKLIDDLKAMLVKDAGILDGGAADKEGGLTKLITSASGQAFLILIREGLEALLVVAAVIAYLVKSGNKRFSKWIYLGVVAGLAGAGLVAVIFVLAFGGSGPIQEIMEGVCALVAMGMLLWTSNWMLNKSSVEAWNRYIKNKTEAAVKSASSQVSSGEHVAFGTVISLAMLSFLAVFREGAETVIFYQSIYTMSQDTHGMWVGGITAAVVLVFIFLLIRFTSVKIPIGPFFLVTSILMSVLVVVFAGGGVHSLIEGDALPATYLQGVPTNDWLGFYPYVECIVAQIIAAIAVIALFVVGFIKQHKRKASAAVEASATKEAAAEQSAEN
ncbi:FTR1 family iron permease [Bifidobacterium imperatoris]|uniref:Iron permease n=1 Tax=Bifidobacterium imperatoris TaxID=2020965 RepID=A0A2N5IRL5_9BIFI|nr:FTR1 family protein [Bifidobacterium imperatoris]PLS24603.1 iron permease [Bifidobacterium imperatoris]QSY58512.1 FTR1 family iron permease [Bifidobacterium imperatoris]